MKIEVKNYGGLVTRSLALPDRGLILLTGPNGSAKTSMLADAPRFAMFGWDGERGDPLASGGEVVFEFGDLRVKRSRGKKGQSVRCAIANDGKEVDCDTATKATAWIEEHYGPAALWEELLVYSWHRASLYSCGSGSDAYRKAQTELLIPTLANFDPALEKCTERRKQHIRGPLAVAQQEVAVASHALQAARDELARIQGLPDTADDPEKLLAEIAPLETRRAALTLRIGTLQEALRQPAPDPQLQALEQELRNASYREQEAKQQLAQAGNGTCPTCRRAWETVSGGAEARAAMQRCLEAAANHRQQLGDSVVALRDQLQSDLRARQTEARVELETLSRRYQTVNETIEKLRQRISRADERRRMGATIDQARARLAAAEDALGVAQAEWVKQDEERQALELAEKMLGPRGARAGLLSRAFEVVEQLANARLAKAWPGSRIQIARTSETAGGKVREVTRVLGARSGETDFDVVGRYSRGQLRKVDLSLLLTRRQVLAAGNQNRLALPYLVIDEALDGLDEESLSGCTPLLVEEAKTNLVIVISHDDRLARGVPFDQHITLGATQ